MIARRTTRHIVASVLGFTTFENRTTILVLLVLIGSVVAVFWQQIFGLATFIGDSDRLNSYLNIRLAEYDSLKQYGRIVSWDNHIFGGMSLAALHWINVGTDPVAWLLQLFARDRVYQVLGYVSICSILAACIAAYGYLRDVIGPGVLAAIGAVCYGLSVFSIHRMAQVDNAHLTVIALPLAILAIRRVRSDNLFWPFLALCTVLICLAYWGFLQEVAYAYLFFGIYALYRSAIFRRDGWMPAVAPIAVFVMAGAVSLLFAFPRLLTVASEFFELVRSHRVNYTNFGQFARFFHEGIYGRYFEEGLLLGNGLNLNEGLQLASSTTLILVVCYGMLRNPTGVERLVVLVFGAMILTLWRPELRVSETMLLICCYTALLGAGWYLFARNINRPMPAEQLQQLPANTYPVDTSFHLFAVVILLLLILTPEGYSLVHYLFGSADFTHSRLSVLLVLPLCTLFTVYVSELISSTSEKHSRLVEHKLKLTYATIMVACLVAWLVYGTLIDRFVPLNTFVVWPYDHFRAVPAVLIKMMITAGVVGGLLLFCHLPIRTIDARLVSGCVIASFVLVETISYAAFKVAGPQTWTYPVAFRNLNYLNVPPSVMRPPTEERLAKVADYLEVGSYRSVLLSERLKYRVVKSSHIAEFWGMRLIGGYGTGVPKRLAELPWSDRAEWLREIELASLSDINFHLLALLNVKYILLLTPDLDFNVALAEFDDPQRRIWSSEGVAYTADMVTVDGVVLRTVRNPVEPLPRHFLVGTVTGVSRTPQVRASCASKSASFDPEICDIGGLRDHSFAEKFTGAQTFDPRGDLNVTYQGDRIDVQVSPSDQKRFVVVNERYHPDWHARSGKSEIAVLPTNAVMMGIEIPSGITHVQLRFEPISGKTRELTVLALFMLASSAGGLRLAEGRSRKAAGKQFSKAK
jgi:Bacterial membrane protein YfhO